MLAPLEDCRILADDLDEAAEIRDLRRALRESRLRLRRSAWQSTRQIAALNAEVSRLQALSEEQRRQLAEYASGAAIVDIGRKLMDLVEANDRLRATAQRVGLIERALAAACVERQHLAAERDALAHELHQARLSFFADSV